MQLSGLKAIVQFAATQRIKSSQAVVQRHFADMLGGKQQIHECLSVSVLPPSYCMLTYMFITVLLPAMSRKNTPSVVEVDFFHLLVSAVSQFYEKQS